MRVFDCHRLTHDGFAALISGLKPKLDFQVNRHKDSHRFDVTLWPAQAHEDDIEFKIRMKPACGVQAEPPLAENDILGTLLWQVITPYRHGRDFNDWIGHFGSYPNEDSAAINYGKALEIDAFMRAALGDAEVDRFLAASKVNGLA